jgi:hypothetical protein
MTLIADPHSQKRKQFIKLVMKYVKKGSGSSIEFLNSRSWTHPVTNLNDIIKQAAIAGTQWRLNDGTSLNVLEFEGDWVVEAIASPNYAPDGLPVIDLPYLVLMKLIAGRSQDIADISRMLGVAEDLQLQRVKKVINQYLPNATEDLESLVMLGKLEQSL